jgi:hypothetical protein
MIMGIYVYYVYFCIEITCIFIIYTQNIYSFTHRFIAKKLQHENRTKRAEEYEQHLNFKERGCFYIYTYVCIYMYACKQIYH